jgi:hypothetical protein
VRDDGEVREFVGRGTDERVTFAEAPGETAGAGLTCVAQPGELLVVEPEEFALDPVVRP